MYHFWYDTDVTPPPVTLSIGWIDPINDPFDPFTVAHTNTGTDTFGLGLASSGRFYVALVGGFSGSTLIWNLDWTPVGSDPAPTITGQDDVAAWVEITYPFIGLFVTSEGLLRVSATVDGVATDVVVMSSGPGAYNPMAWGPE